MAATLLWPAGIRADYYGRSSFGNCGFSSDCPTPSATPGLVILDSGLKVAFNLTDGQIIPYNGYTVVITPLNGEGASFKQAEFFAGGRLAATIIPAADGTASWFWDPRKNPGTDVKIVVTATDGSSTSSEFNVKIGAAPAAGHSVTSFPLQALGTVIKVPTQIIATLKHAVRSLPRPVVNSFPYLLFILLGVNLLLLFLQAQREFHENQTLQRLVARNRLVMEAKSDLADLVNHYLHTPVAKILGGIDLLKMHHVQNIAVDNLQQLALRLRSKINQLLAGTEEIPAASGIAHTDVAWWQPRILVPMIMVAGVLALFDYLAASAGRLSSAEISIFTQLIIFGGISLATYQVFRRLQLHRTDTRQLQLVMREEKEANQLRDGIMSGTVAALKDDVRLLSDTLAPLSAEPDANFITDGLADITKVLAQFSVAELVRGGHSERPFEPVEIKLLVAKAMQILGPNAAAHHILVEDQTALVAQVQSSTLLTYVLKTVIENAIAYSADGSKVMVEARRAPKAYQITITDHGNGISPDKLPLLFQAFTKVEGTRRFNHEGMGFSLYLDKLIMSYLGGSIAVESEPGRGTRVELLLPFEERPAHDKLTISV